MNRTRWIFFGVIGVAIAIIVISVIARSVSSNPIGPAAPSGPIEVRIVVALPIEPWVTAAANQFNSENHQLDNNKIHVTIIPMDGLTALSRYDSDAFDPKPTAWIPDSRYLVELANAAYKDRVGRDVFLTDGEYRAKPIALSLFAWGIYGSRACWKLNLLTSIGRLCMMRRSQPAAGPIWAAIRRGASSNSSCRIRARMSAGSRRWSPRRVNITIAPTSVSLM
jgi:hypothetical protein